MNLSRKSIFSPRILPLLFCVAMLFVSLPLLGAICLPVAGALFAFTLLQKKSALTWLWLVAGVAVSYVAAAILAGFDFYNPLYALWPLLVLPFALCVLVAKKWHLSRTATILMMTVSFCVLALGYVAATLLWYYGGQAWQALWSIVAQFEQSIYAVFASISVEGTPILSAEVVQQMLYMVKAIFPACAVLFAMLLSYLSTVCYRSLCQRLGRMDLLSTFPYEITVSTTTAMLYVPLMIATMVWTGTTINAPWAAVQNLSLLLAPGLAYCEVRRVIFRIRNRQMDFFSYFLTAMFVIYFFQNPLDTMRFVALLGAVNLLLLAWARYRKNKKKD